MSGNTRQRVQTSLKNRVSVGLAWLLGHILYRLPQAWVYWLADRAGIIIYHLFPTYRRNVRDNITRVLGPDTPPAEVDRVVRRVFQTSARNFTDMLRVPYMPADRLSKMVRTAPGAWEVVENALAQGRGVIMATAHLGAFDFVAQILALRGFDVTVLTTRTVPEFIHAAVDYLRGSRGLKLEHATPGGVRRVVRALKDGAVVGIVADRDFFQSGVPAVFFGHETTLPPGPIRIARQTGAMIVPAFAPRVDGGYELIIEQPFVVPRTNDAEADLRVGLERLIAAFERHIRRVPEQWVMFQRVWPARVGSALRVFPIGSPLEGELLGRGADVARPLTAPPESPTDRTGSPPSPVPESVPRPATRRE